MHNTILWLHGFPLSSASFAPQRAIPAIHVMPDLPGFGSTPARAGMTIEDYARFALAELDHRGIDQVTLAGFSMGGYVAFAVARLAPERVRGLLLIDTRETPDSEDARRGRLEMIAKVGAEGVQVVADAMLPKMLTSGAPPDMTNRVREIMLSASPEGTITALGAMANRADSSSLLPTLTIPALVVVGEEDAITPPADAERMARLLPSARLVRIANASHMANYEQSEMFNRAVEEWMNRS